MRRMIDLASRYYHTGRHLKPHQVIGRPWRRIVRRASPYVLPSPPGELSGNIEAAIPFTGHDPWNAAQRLRDGHWVFLDREAALGFPPRWHDPQLPLLWQFNLHYFQYLTLLSAEERRAVCRDWVRENAVASMPGWHPYPLSVRIINWIKFGDLDDEMAASLYRQAAYLYRNMETDLGGNHLVENARALIFAGMYWGDKGEAHRWTEAGLTTLRQELRTQVLPDGGHFERSTMYHAIMLEAVLDVINITAAANHQAHWLTDAAERMLAFEQSVCFSDGDRALLNDATSEIAPTTAQLVDYARSLGVRLPKRQSSFPDTGVFVHKGERFEIVIDGGIIGPDHLPAHSHADIFSFEMSAGGTRFIVDTGVDGYQAGKVRDYVRSTGAHNTVTVDGVDQAECWGAFRVARRFPPEDVRFSSLNGISDFRGIFRGYATLIGDGIAHERRIDCDERSRCVRVSDEVTGSGTHLVESRVHLHPDVELTRQGDSWIMSRGSTRCSVTTRGGEVTVAESFHAPRFGAKVPNLTMTIGREGSLPASLGYVISMIN